jgi:ATP-dependent Clp protease ATP-binding subunit ClpA
LTASPTLAKSGRGLSVTPEALWQIVSDRYRLACGARFLKRVIEATIKLPISSGRRKGRHSPRALRKGRSRFTCPTRGQFPALAATA